MSTSILTKQGIKTRERIVSLLRHPMTDRQIRDALADSGYTITRENVAKHRRILLREGRIVSVGKMKRRGPGHRAVLYVLAQGVTA